MDELYENYGKSVYGYLYSQCHNKTIAEDLTQETFLRAYQSLERYDGTCKLSVWLCQIAKHLWYQYLEKHKREVLQDIQEELPYDKGIEEQIFTKYELIEVLREIHRLPESMREVVYLRMASELSFREIGEILGKSENWARVNFYRGKEKIVKGLKEHE